VFFEFKVGADVVLFNLAQVTRIQVAPHSGEHALVTFFFTDGREESVPLQPATLQKLYTAIPRPSIYGSGGMG
jgi:hypothetical protein